MIVRIKKIDRSINWGAKDPSTNKIKTMFDNCMDKLVPGLDKHTGGLRTGLTPKEEAEFEKELGYEKGELAKSSPFWSRFSIMIPEGGLTLDTDNSHHKLQYKVLESDPNVAKSLTELRTHATAEYVMTSEGAEAKVLNSKRDVITKAYTVFGSLSKAEMIDALYMFGKDGSDMNFDVAQNRLGEIVDKDPAKFMLTIGDPLFKDKVWIMKLIKNGTIKKHGTGTGPNQPLYYNDTMLGNGLEEVIAFVKDNENQQIAAGLKKALK